MTMRKTIAILIALMMVLAALAGCSSNQTAAPDATQAPAADNGDAAPAQDDEPAAPA